MKRPLRITLELLGPALIGSILIYVYVGVIGIYANKANGVGWGSTGPLLRGRP